MNGYNVEPGDLRSAATAIEHAVEAANGMDLESVPGKGSSYGHAGLTKALQGYCQTWDVAKQLLQERSNSAAEALHGAANKYERQEGDASSTTSEAAAPHAQPLPVSAPTP